MEGARDDYHGHGGAEDLEALSRYDGLHHFRVNSLGAFCLGLAEGYRPRPDSAAARPWRVLPNLDVVFMGERLPVADRLLLEQYAEPRSEGVWALEQRKLLAAVGRGAGIEGLERFLRDRAAASVPDTVLALLDEVRRRLGRLTDLGTVRLLECADPHLARQLANDRHLRGLCRLVGECHLAVSLDQEEAFRRALVNAGYALQAEAAATSLP